VPLLSCLCGATIEAFDANSLNTAYWAHADQEHKDLKLSGRRRRDAGEAILRTGGWDGERRDLPGPLDVRPLAPGDCDAYLRYFDREALPDNPAWASCYCITYNVNIGPDEFEERTAAENRDDKAAMIRRGDATGVLAYSQGNIVGWCNAGPRAGFPLLDRYPEFAADGDQETAGAIVCFVIAPPYRGQGIAGKLLAGACDMLRDRGLTSVYGYPPRGAATAAGAYHGTLSMYRAVGFTETGAASQRYVTVRKSL
jgi:GNAT superfamily N-acetyltransferase